MKISWSLTDNNITVNYLGQTHILPRGTAIADSLIEALKKAEYDSIPDLVTAARRVEKFSNGLFTLKDNEVLVEGKPVNTFLGNKIVKFANEGLPVEPLVKFAANLAKNPSYRAVNELYQFLEKNDHPLTENGCFIAYKKVKEDFKDVHTGKFDNSPGQTLKMPRNEVNEDPNVTCSHGLHVANFEYASQFYAGGIMLEVEVNPEHVVSVPVDYNNAKIRTCQYKVIGVVDSELSQNLRVVDVPDDLETNRDLGYEEEEEDEYCTECGEFIEECVCDDYDYGDEE